MTTTMYRMRALILIPLIVALVGQSCTLPPRSIESIPTIDRNATNETKALFINLWTLADSNQTLFGHQDDLYFGVGWVGDPGRSDIKTVAHSYPAVYGWEVSAIELGSPNSGDGVPFDTMRENIIAGYLRGGVITLSWHMNNPVTYDLIGTDPDNNRLGTAFDTTPAVSTILPGGSNHAMYRRWLDAFAAFDRSLTVSGAPWNPSEHLVPVIFRPFHEHNGGTFWWGRGNASEAEYIALWIFTVRYLRDTAGLHNLLYAFSPDARYTSSHTKDYSYPDLATFEAEYNYAYPGDTYVDVLGLDFYQNMFLIRRGVDDALVGEVAFQSILDRLVESAHNRGGGRSDSLKIPALTEIGLQRWDLPNANHWWTQYLYPGLVGTRPSGGQPAYVLTWGNSSDTDRSAPYDGSLDSSDFADFAAKPMIHLEDEIPIELYTWP